MSQQKLRVADVLRCCWTAYNRTHRLPPFVARTVNILLKCRTAVLGGHIYQCDQCGSEVPLYNSCKNRNCPTCQNVEKEKWLARRLREVLPVPYYHTVFTLPHELNDLVNGNRRLLLDELFKTGKWVLQRFAHDPQWRLKGELGMIAILHTWNQRLMQHFHVHYLIPGGVWREESEEFIVCKGNWLFKKSSLADAFRNRFIKRLRTLRASGKLDYPQCCCELAEEQNWDALLNKLKKTKWVVYPKRVPSTPEKALEYLARYTHRIAISDYRIKQIENGCVTYTWRDRASPDGYARTSRADGNREKEECIPVEEFTKRFLQHVLPRGFKKIRFYGWMSNTKRKSMLPIIRRQLEAEPPELHKKETAAQTILRRTGYDVTCCPNCKKGTLSKTTILLPKAQGP
jgi:hypothetical protein